MRFCPEKNLFISCLSVSYPFFNQVGGKARGPQYLLCKWCLISSVFSTLHVDSSCTERLHFSVQTRNSAVLLPPWGRGSHPEEIEHLGSACYLNGMQSCVSSSLLPLPLEMNYGAKSWAPGDPGCFPVASLGFSVPGSATSNVTYTFCFSVSRCCRYYLFFPSCPYDFKKRSLLL